MMFKLKILTYLLIIIFFNSCVSYSQKTQELKTKLLWIEQYQGHYTSGEDTMVKGSLGGFVSFLKDTLSISKRNYLKSYYEIDFDNSNLLKNDSLISDKDWYNNQLVASNFYDNSVNRHNTIKIEYNNFWKYELCKVTFIEFYVGKVEQFVPKFESAKESPWLEYEQIKIPTYLIKIKSIAPYIKE